MSSYTELAKALPLLSRHSLRMFSLNFNDEDSSNHYFSPPTALLPSEPSTDHLSRVLHRLSQSPSLISFDLDSIVISPDLYWPTNLSTPPMWPKLRHFHVTFDMTTPDGHWDFVPSPAKPGDTSDEDDDDDHESVTESDSSDSDSTSTSTSSSLRPDTFLPRREDRAAGDFSIRHFRTLPCDAHMNPLLIAMARAAAHMPQLQRISLETTMRDHDGGAGFEIYFHGLGQRTKLDCEPGDAEKARLYLVVGS